jgi:2-dehydro-3-deoxygluconokinase
MAPADLARRRAARPGGVRRSTEAQRLRLPSFEDEAKLWGDASPEATIERLTTFGVKEIVVKNGSDGAVMHADGRTVKVPVPEKVEPIDPIATGDSFNAAFLAARLKGEKPEAAVLAGHRLAAQVLRHRGAILPRPKGNGGRKKR